MGSEVPASSKLDLVTEVCTILHLKKYLHPTHSFVTGGNKPPSKTLITSEPLGRIPNFNS